MRRAGGRGVCRARLLGTSTSSTHAREERRSGGQSGRGMREEPSRPSRALHAGRSERTEDGRAGEGKEGRRGGATTSTVHRQAGEFELASWRVELASRISAQALARPKSECGAAAAAARQARRAGGNQMATKWRRLLFLCKIATRRADRHRTKCGRRACVRVPTHDAPRGVAKPKWRPPPRRAAVGKASERSACSKRVLFSEKEAFNRSRSGFGGR